MNRVVIASVVVGLAALAWWYAHRGAASACTADSDCATGDVCNSQGACAAPVALGDSCVGSADCAPGDVCDESNVCAVPVALNAACTGSRDCAPGDVCNSAKVCAVPIALGSACAGTSDCVADGVCGSTGKCATPVASGGTCAWNVDCATNLTCNNTVCGPAVIYTATPNAATWASESSGDYTCASTLQDGYCILPLDTAGPYCNGDANCKGYLIPGPTTSWIANVVATTPTAVQLYSKPLVAATGASDTTVMAKSAA